MAAITPNPPAPRDPDRDAATIMRLRKEVADLKAAALTPPEGYVLVPVEPTEGMLDELYRAESDMPDEELHALWSATLAARPEVP